MSFWIDRPVLVTGATGLLGSWLVRHLLDLQADVVCLVRDWQPNCELVRSGEIDQVTSVRGDICDQALMERILGEYEISTVFHLAAQTIVGVANRYPLSTFESNVKGTWVILEACRRNPSVQQVIVASSDKAYGENASLPYLETHPLRGAHPYDVSKSCADLIAQSFAHTYDLPVAITRCGNLFGGGDLNWNRIVPGTIRSVLRDAAPIIRSDGQFVRDYFYVEDAVEAYLLTATKLAEDRSLHGHAFNFSNEVPLSVSELVAEILMSMDSTLQPEVLNQASNEIREQYLCAEKARRLLNWKPHFDLQQGITRTIAWYKEFFSTGSRHSSIRRTGV